MKCRVVVRHLKTDNVFKGNWESCSQEDIDHVEKLIQGICEGGGWFSIENNQQTPPCLKSIMYFPKKLIQECVFSVLIDED